MSYLLLFHSNIGYLNAHCSYVYTHIACLVNISLNHPEALLAFQLDSLPSVTCNLVYFVQIILMKIKFIPCHVHQPWEETPLKQECEQENPMDRKTPKAVTFHTLFLRGDRKLSPTYLLSVVSHRDLWSLPLIPILDPGKYLLTNPTCFLVYLCSPLMKKCGTAYWCN